MRNPLVGSHSQMQEERVERRQGGGGAALQIRKQWSERGGSSTSSEDDHHHLATAEAHRMRLWGSSSPPRARTPHQCSLGSAHPHALTAFRRLSSSRRCTSSSQVRMAASAGCTFH